MRVVHEIAIFQTVKSKVIISLFETVRLSVSISLRNLYNSLNSIKENRSCHVLTKCFFFFKIAEEYCFSENVKHSHRHKSKDVLYAGNSLLFWG